MILLHRSKTSTVVIFYTALLSVLIFQLVKQVNTNQADRERNKKISEAFAHLPFEAKAVYVFDTSNSTALYGAHSHKPLPLASITKIATAMCTLEKLGRYSTVSVNGADLYKEVNGLVAGDVWRTEDLVTFMLVESSNNAAKTLARAYGGEAQMVCCMNALTRKLGIFDTKFLNSTGLDIGRSPGAYGTAEEATKLLLAGMNDYPDIFGRTAYKSYNVTSVNGRQYKAVNTDRAIDDIPGLIASKTGHTEIAGGNLVFEMDAGLHHRIVVAILGSSEEGRFTDAVTISNAVAKALAEKQ